MDGNKNNILEQQQQAQRLHSSRQTKRYFFGEAQMMVQIEFALGTHSHLYILKADVLYDITPLRKTSSSLSNPLATTDGSTTVTYY